VILGLRTTLTLLKWQHVVFLNSFRSGHSTATTINTNTAASSKPHVSLPTEMVQCRRQSSLVNATCVPRNLFSTASLCMSVACMRASKIFKCTASLLCMSIACTRFFVVVVVGGAGGAVLPDLLLAPPPPPPAVLQYFAQPRSSASTTGQCVRSWIPILSKSRAHIPEFKAEMKKNEMWPQYYVCTVCEGMVVAKPRRHPTSICFHFQMRNPLLEADHGMNVGGAVRTGRAGALSRLLLGASALTGCGQSVTPSSAISTRMNLAYDRRVECCWQPCTNNNGGCWS
jgi:hypothetical protein